MSGTTNPARPAATSALGTASDLDLAELADKLPILPEHKFLAAMTLLAPLAERREVTEIMNVARPRLRMLKPVRPLTVKRLLCQPFEDLFAVGKTRPDELRIPRAVIEPLWDLLEQRIPGVLRTLEQEVKLAAAWGEQAERRLGERVWREAATALAGAIPEAHPHALSFKTILGTLVLATDIEDFKSACPAKPLARLDQEAERSIVGTLQRLLEKKLPNEAFLLIVAARMEFPTTLLALVERHELPRSALFAQRIEGVAVAQLAERAQQFTEQAAELGAESLAREAEHLLHSISETSKIVGQKSRTELESKAGSLKISVRNAILEKVIAPSDAAIAPALDDAEDTEALSAAESHARALHRSCHLAGAIGLGDRASATVATLRRRFDSRISSCLERARSGRAEGDADRGQATRGIYRSIRMIELLEGTGAANEIFKQAQRQLRQMPA